ncbi:hypothetical protein Patl1_23870 [Pistacia atlantica]|uniref:Uncharacterized protein n=1 Tax=Pistacia atlantica TaxID=434234 RepID=A0ACC1A0N4_9ROSI|nr:hypothetical protein Patl1_23870 [Pistacia atlantica]
MESNKKHKNSCSCFPFSLFKTSTSKRPPGPAPGVWMPSGSDEEKAAVSRVRDDDSDINKISEKFIKRFLESCQVTDTDSEIEVEVMKA